MESVRLGSHLIMEDLSGRILCGYYFICPLMEYGLAIPSDQSF